MNPGHDYFSLGINPSPTDEEITVLFSGEAQPQPLHKMGPTIHDYYLIHTVLSGQGEFIIRDRLHQCGPGDTFVIFPGELFTYQADKHDPWSYAWLAFNGQRSADIMASLDISPEHPVLSGSLNPSVRHYYERLLHCFDSATFPELANMEAGGWARLLLQHLGISRRKHAAVRPVADTATDVIMKQAIQYVTLQYSQPLSIQHLSGMLGYHRTHLCKLFKQSTGLSPMQYLLKIRMQRAELLLATSMTIDQVASSVGFGDALYFSRKFRKWCGQSPSEYRKALRT